MNSDNDTPKDEYPEDLIKSGDRGKYTKSYREGKNVVPIDPDLHELFPDSDANFIGRPRQPYEESEGGKKK